MLCLAKAKNTELHNPMMEFERATSTYIMALIKAGTLTEAPIQIIKRYHDES